MSQWHDMWYGSRERTQYTEGCSQARPRLLCRVYMLPSAHVQPIQDAYRREHPER
jgi:hypothetical protein